MLCEGDFCTYWPNISIDDGKVYDDYGEIMILPYRDHCDQWHNTNLFVVKEKSGSLSQENVSFVEVRAQYRTLIYMINSSNLMMQNTHFQKVQTKPDDTWELWQ